LAVSIDAVRERFGEEAITRARLLAGRPHRRFDFGERPGRRGEELEPSYEERITAEVDEEGDARDPTDEDRAADLDSGIDE
jgi:hypothetical protein